MSAPIALELYTVRAEAQQDFAGVLDRVAAIGYVGVEVSGLHGMPAGELRSRLDALGLELMGAFGILPPAPGENGATGAAAEMVIDERFLEAQQMLGNDVVVAGLMPAEVASLDALDRGAERLNRCAELVRGRQMALGYHNHWWEFESRDGWTPMTSLLERVEPDVFLEVDIYWLQTAGLDPVETLAELGSRVRRLHVKDGPCVQGVPQTALGDGRVDLAAVLAAAPQADWHVVELDEYAGQMFEAVEASYGYLTERGLSNGRS
jgi:sugar phosphate isomerase/epimerase